MGHVSISEQLSAASDRVWSNIVNPVAWEEWLTIHSGWLEEPPTEAVVGVRLVEKVVMLGMANKIEWFVDTVDAPHTLTISGSGMAGVKSRFTFTLKPIGDGTDVTIEAEFSGSLIVGALGKALERDAASNLGESLAKLDAVSAA